MDETNRQKLSKHTRTIRRSARAGDVDEMRVAHAHAVELVVADRTAYNDFEDSVASDMKLGYILGFNHELKEAARLFRANQFIPGCQAVTAAEIYAPLTGIPKDETARRVEQAYSTYNPHQVA